MLGFVIAVPDFDGDVAGHSRHHRPRCRSFYSAKLEKCYEFSTVAHGLLTTAFRDCRVMPTLASASLAACEGQQAAVDPEVCVRQVHKLHDSRELGCRQGHSPLLSDS
jgi:hypothetical protein